MLDHELLLQSAKIAGKIALGYWDTGFDVQDKPDGAGPVTDADIAVDRALKQALLSARPDYGWLSEESDMSADRLSKRHVFVVDPIDGTRSYIAKDTSWAHSLAIVDDGIVTHGVIYLPARDLMYSAVRGKGAFLNGAPITASQCADITTSTLLGARPILDPNHWKAAQVPGFTQHYRPSLAYRMALVAQGRFDAMLTLRATWEWDICAGALIASEAGATVSDKFGNALRFNSPAAQVSGVLAAAPEVHQQIIDASDF